MKLKLITLAVLCALVFAACGGPTTQPSYAALSTAAPAATESPVEQGVTDRLIIKNADLSIVVDDPASTVSAITQLAEGSGGFVVSVNTYQTTLDGQRAQQAQMVVRVPSAKLNEVLSQIRALAVEVQRENISGQDVTADYVDLQSRLNNLEVKEDQLQAIMERATDTEDVLKVYNELSKTREEIEVIKGQMKYYEQAAAMSAVSLDIIPNAASQPVEVGGWHPEGVAKDSIELLVRIWQTLIDFLIGFTIVCGPFIVLLGVPGLLFVRWARKRRQNIQPAAKEEK